MNCKAPRYLAQFLPSMIRAITMPLETKNWSDFFKEIAQDILEIYNLS